MSSVLLKFKNGLRSAILLSLPVGLLLLLIQGVFNLLIWIEDIPKFNFDLYLQSMARIGKAELPDSDIIIPPPASLARKYTLPAAQHLDDLGNTVSVHHGFRRTRPFTKHKPPGTRRVLVIGDSWAWGYRLDDRETFAHHLEERLRARPVDGVESVEVLNAGIIASTIPNWHESLRHNDVEFEPDVVVVNFCDNDISELTSDRSISPTMYYMLQEMEWIAPVRYFFAKSILARQQEVLDAVGQDNALAITQGRFGVKPWVSHITWPDDIQDFLANKTDIPLDDIRRLLQLYYYSEPSIILPYTSDDDEFTAHLWERWENELVKIRDLGREKNFTVVMNIFPIFPRIYEREFDDRRTPEKIIREICERHDIRVVDTLAEFREAEPALRRAGRSFFQLPEDSHPSAEGQDIVAAALEREIREILNAR